MQVKNRNLAENAKIRRTAPANGQYYIMITSDLEGDARNREAAYMSALVSLKKDKYWPYDFERPAYHLDKSGAFGWGYLINDTMPPEQTEQLLSNLKFLVAEYNKKKNIAEDAETAGLSFDQIEELMKLTDSEAIKAAAEQTQNPKFKNNLENYLIELGNAIEKDEVFEFLIENFEKAKNFQKRNSGYKYSILNSLIVTAADPTAMFAGPEYYWQGRNYQIKSEFKGKGIYIIKPSGRSDMAQKVDYFRKHPEALEAFKREMGIDPAEEIIIPAKAVTSEDKALWYQLASFATKEKYVRSFMNKFIDVMVYTNNMVEPIAGKAPVEVEDLYFKEPENFTEDISPLFSAVMAVAKKQDVAIPFGLDSDKTNINNFNRILHAVATRMVAGKTSKGADMEYLKVQGESIVYLVKKYFNLPAEAAKYNIASWGGDRAKLQAANSLIMRQADALIDAIDTELKNSKQALNEFRRLVRQTLLGN